MATIQQLLPASRFQTTRFFTDVVDLLPDEEDGYTGCGTYAVAVFGGRIALHRLNSSADTFITDELRESAWPWFNKQFGAQLFFATGSTYQLMNFRL